jgi:hypothetical protein
MIFVLIKQGQYCDQCDQMVRVNLLASFSKETLEAQKTEYETYEVKIDAASREFNEWWREIKPYHAAELVQQFQDHLISQSEYQEKCKEHNIQAEIRISAKAAELGEKYGVLADETKSGSQWYYLIEEIKINGSKLY